MKQLLTVFLLSTVVGCAYQPPVREVQEGFFVSSRNPVLKFKLPDNWEYTNSHYQKGFERYNSGQDRDLFGNTMNNNQHNFAIKGKPEARVIDSVTIQFERTYGNMMFTNDFADKSAYIKKDKERFIDGRYYNTGYLVLNNQGKDKGCYLHKTFFRTLPGRKHSFAINLYKGVECMDRDNTAINALIKQNEAGFNQVVNEVILHKG
ncbi:hypothetical protein [Spartinivicinus poritis]|uniref:Lipoprotein n=1 Tax=Spartinivicinus poritis TaxID=2994640 RepID=A0ABT5UF03_9GAMM|nr:hypothetical protein [Spartinivicinus sp. A2-2]MDE1464946.1 hypothetical protein [Spartinivicinus sp. A2-2]